MDGNGESSREMGKVKVTMDNGKRIKGEGTRDKGQKGKCLGQLKTKQGSGDKIQGTIVTGARACKKSQGKLGDRWQWVMVKGNGRNQ